MMRYVSHIQVCGMLLLFVSSMGTVAALVENYVISSIILGVLTVAFPTLAYFASRTEQNVHLLHLVLSLFIAFYLLLIVLTVYTVISFIGTVASRASSPLCNMVKISGPTRDTSALHAVPHAPRLRSAKKYRSVKSFTSTPAPVSFGEVASQRRSDAEQPVSVSRQLPLSSSGSRGDTKRLNSSCPGERAFTYASLLLAAVLLDMILGTAFIVVLVKLLTLRKRTASETAATLQELGKRSPLHNLCTPSLLTRPTDLTQYSGKSSRTSEPPRPAIDARSVEASSEELRRIRQWVQVHPAVV